MAQKIRDVRENPAGFPGRFWHQSATHQSATLSNGLRAQIFRIFVYLSICGAQPGSSKVSSL
jgi:hypothetical protein